MKAKKLEKRHVDLDVTEVTLLSAEEYETYKENIPLIKDEWWLKTKGLAPACVETVNPDGSVDTEGYDTDFGDIGMRPALKIANLKEMRLLCGDKFTMAGCVWTVISDDCALCDKVIAKVFFNDDHETKDAGDYETSDIKRHLTAWWDKVLKQERFKLTI